MTVTGKPINIWAKERRSGKTLWFHIWEGTGDNLLQEDIELGYVDYLNYEYFETLSDVYEQENYDGGMILLRKLAQNMTIEEVLKEVEDFEDTELELVEID